MIHVCVVYSDLVGWSKLPTLAEQVNSARTLFTHLTQRIGTQGLTAVWKTSTGDGFCVAFPRSEAVRVLQLCHDLLDQYTVREPVQLRLAIAEGSLDKFANPLTYANDYTGSAVIKARRILDGITYGSTLLVKKDLALDLTKLLPRVLSRQVVFHAAITDKHGETHEVCQILASRDYPKRLVRKAPQSLAELFNAAKSEAIRKTERSRNDSLFATDGLIFLWLDHTRQGLDASAIKVTRGPTASHTPPIVGLPAKFRSFVIPYYEEAKTRYGPPNDPKVGLTDLIAPITDRPTLQLTVEDTDYWTSRAMGLAYEKGNLQAEFENKTFDIYTETPGLLFTCNLIITDDDKLILAQRKARDVDVAGGAFSPSFEEQWNPLKDKTPTEAVLRGLSEEFNLDRNHDVYLSVDNVRLLAVAREWGEFWTTGLIYCVRLPAPAAKLIECWSALPPPKDKDEHSGVCAVPMRSDAGKRILTRAIESGRVPCNDLLQLRDCDRAGTLSEGFLHPTSGKARIILSLYCMNVLK